MKKKYFVTSDIHSFFTEFHDALLKAGFDIKNDNHILIVCGDVFDRGTESKELLDYLLAIPDNRFIYIRGNHEDLMEDMLNRGYIYDFDISNGTVKTLCDLIGCEEYEIYNKIPYAKEILSNTKYYTLLNKSIDYKEIGDYIFVHGWIPHLEPEKDVFIYDPNWREASSSEWGLARWDNGMDDYFKGVREPGKTIVCGHWHCSYGNIRKNGYIPKNKWEELDSTRPELFEPFESDGIIALDACTSLTHKVNIKVLEIEDNSKK